MENKETILNREMYIEEILDLYKNPHNYGKIENPTLTIKQANPLCGDEITLYLEIKGNKIFDVKFLGKGCAISIAGASLITDKIKGMTINEVKELSKEDLLDLLAIPISPARIKCALLSLEAVKGAIK